MNIQVWSDLHLEFSAGQQEKPKVDEKTDVLVLAGDIGVGAGALEWMKSLKQARPDIEIIYVAGNHEFYHQEYNSCLEKIEDLAKEYGIHFLENKMLKINNYYFLGATLWTDFKLFGPERFLQAKSEVGRCLNDFRVINQKGQRFNTDMALKMHNDSVWWLKNTIKEIKNNDVNGQIVVISHHGPSMESVALKYKTNLVSAGFCSNFSPEMFDDISLWLHGHVHDGFDYTIGSTRVVANPRGYMMHSGCWENKQWNEKKLIDLSVPTNKFKV